MRTEFARFLRMPRPEGAGRISGTDRVLALLLAPTVVLEGVFREGLVRRPFEIAFGLLLAGAVAIRRRFPFGAPTSAFALATFVALVRWAFGLPEVALYASVSAILLPYTLVRWGSGREIAVGYAVVTSTFFGSMLAGDMHAPSDAIGGALTLLFPGALGAFLRSRAEGHRKDVEHAKTREREHIARDLHDSVAHHVSAIAIQAQAARAVLAVRPEAAADALGNIESEAKRTLSELRSMVRTLRDERSATLEPGVGVRDLPRLASALGTGLCVEVVVDEGADALSSGVQGAVYRVAQESITNAARHAAGASRVDVRVTLDDGDVTVSVENDGESPLPSGAPGFGLVGMAERAKLLGGTFSAGPRKEGGWRVRVVLPRRGSSP
ncbi:MAG: histidine kinase [Polyangiaceae bacterium]